MDFIGEQELISFNREDLDKIIGRLQNQIIEKVLCSIPDMVIQLAKRTDMMNRAVEELYKTCPECKDDKVLLTSIVQKIEMDNIGKSPAEIFALVPSAYRKAKGLADNLPSIDMSKLNETVNGVI